MADETPETSESAASEVVGQIAGEAVRAAASAEAHAEVAAEAVADLEQEVEDETKWLRERVTGLESAVTQMAQTVAALPEILGQSVSEALKSLTPPPESQPENPVLTPESPEAPEPVVAVVTSEPDESPQDRKKPRYL